MQSRFEAVGELGFPLDKKIRCAAFVWRCPPEFGRFTIRFLCPLEETPRRFFIEPFLKDLKQPTPSKFVDQACKCGAKILRKLEAGLGIPTSDEPFWPAIFRQRAAGHTSVRRRFDDITDFVKYDRSSQRAELILPGTDLPNKKMTFTDQAGYERKKQDVNHLLQLLLPENKRYYSLSDVFAYMRRLIDARTDEPVADGRARAQYPLDLFAHRSPLDQVLMDGVPEAGKAVEFLGLCRKVGGALISELSLPSDMQVAEDHKAEFRRFLDRIDKRLRASKTAKEFDQWFKNEREHGFVRLLKAEAPASAEDQSPDAITRAKAYFRVLLWLSHEMMSRCYGALMLVAWLDFCDDKTIRPSDFEQVLFRRMHAPQYYLAGIPVVFLGPAPLRFIAERLLLEVWAPAKALHPEAYVPLADMLSCYAFLNVERRSADREEKRGAAGAPKVISTGEVTGEAPPEEEEPDDGKSPPMLSSLGCQTCGHPLQHNRVLDASQDDTLAIEFYCPKCDRFQSNRVSLSWLESLEQAARER